MIVDGLWTWSENEERWPCDDGWPTRDAAIASADAELEAGTTYYVGRAESLKGRHLAPLMLPEMDLVEERLSDEGGWWFEESVLGEPSTEARTELMDLLAAWADRSGIIGGWHRINDVERRQAQTRCRSCGRADRIDYHLLDDPEGPLCGECVAAQGVSACSGKPRPDANPS